MRQMRRVVFGLDDLCPILAGLGKRRVDIADIADDFAGLSRSFFQRLAERPGVVDRVRTAVPFDLQTLAP